MTTTVSPIIMPAELQFDLTPQEEVALLGRILYREGYNDHASGHITYRQPDDTFLALPMEFGWNEACASDVIRIDIDGNLLEGKWSVPPAIGVHLEYHRAKPGRMVTVHQHPEYATIWSAAGRIRRSTTRRRRSCSTTSTSSTTTTQASSRRPTPSALRSPRWATRPASCSATTASSSSVTRSRRR